MWPDEIREKDRLTLVQRLTAHLASGPCLGHFDLDQAARNTIKTFAIRELQGMTTTLLMIRNL